MGKFIIQPHFRLQEWVAEEKGYFNDEGLDYVFNETDASRPTGKAHDTGDKIGAYPDIRERPHVRHQLRLPLDRECRGLQGPRQALRRCLLGRAGGRIRAAGIRRSHRPSDLAGVPISVGYQSGSHYSTIQALEQYLPARQDQSLVRRGHAVQPHGTSDRPQGPGGGAVQRALLFRRAAGLPQDHRHDLHDRDHDHRQSRSGRRARNSSAR